MMKQLFSMEYTTPQLEVLELGSETVLCASAEQGGAGSFEEVTW